MKTLTPGQWVLLGLLTIFVICLKLSDSFVLPPSIDSEQNTNPRPLSRHIRSVFSVPVKPQTECPEGSRRTEAGDCVEVAPEIKGGGDKFLINSLQNFYRTTTTRKPPRRRRTTTTTTTTTTPMPDPASIEYETTTPNQQSEETTTLQADQETTDPTEESKNGDEETTTTHAWYINTATGNQR